MNNKQTLLQKIGKRKVWEPLAVVFASLLVLFCAVYEIALDNSATLNNTFHIESSEIERSDEEEYQYFKREYEDENALESYYASVAEQAEAEGLVLTKNDGALPLKEGSEVSLFFTGAADIAYGSTGSSAIASSSYATLRDELEEVGLSVNEELWNFYVNGEGSRYGRSMQGLSNYLVNEVPLAKYGTTLNNVAGTAVVVLTRDTGEGKDINMTSSDTMDGSYLTISREELEVLADLTARKQSGQIDNIVVLLNSSAAMQLDFLFGEYAAEGYKVDVDAVMWIGYPGKYGLSAVAKALVGEIAPSGRLTDTYARDNLSSPAAASESYSEGFAQVYSNYISDYSSVLGGTQAYYGVYVEGIYVGYRYYETRYTDAVNGEGNTEGYDYSADVAYPFGYGLSYTSFAYSDFSVSQSEDGETFTLSVTVKNSGSCAGKEVVQVYLQKPYTEYDRTYGVEKAAVELVGYGKTEELAPGESCTLTVEVSRKDFASYDANQARTYIVEEGDYYLTVADNAHDAANNILEYVDGEAKTDRASAAYYDTNSTNNGMVFAASEEEFDAVSYSVSSETDTPITNRLDSVDINKYEGRGENSVTYVSRSDWKGTFPSSAVSLSITEQMAKDLAANQEIEEDEEAQMPTYGANNKISLVTMRGKDYNDEEWELLLDQMTLEEQSLLITNAGWTTVAVSSVNKPDTKEADGPVGIVYSTGARSMPCQGIWAATFNDELVQSVGDALAEDTLNAGYTGLYANGANLHRSPFGGRSAEYFSEDSFLAGNMSMYEIRGIQNKGVIVHVKHVAFNDMEDQRSGICVWLNEQEARELMLEVFEYSLAPSKGNGHAVMSGFNRVGTDWAGADDELLNGIIRGEFGFDGYCITDMADSNGASYMTYQDGVMNGTDCWLGNGSETALASLAENASFAQNMRESCHRILYAVTNFSASMNGITPDTPVGVVMPWWQAVLIAAVSVVAVLTAVSGAMYLYCAVCGRRRKIKN